METKRCILRIVNKDDRIDLYNILRQDKVVEYLNMKKPTSLIDIDNLIEKYLNEYKNKAYEPYTILDKKTNKVIGMFILKLDLYNEDAYEYTTYIDPMYWNKGITTEILSYMVSYFFTNYKINNFRGYVMDKNISSMKVLEKCNFHLEKIFDVDGIDNKIHSYLMTREDYEK